MLKKDDIKKGIEKGIELHNNAHLKWVSEEGRKLLQNTKVFYDNSYFAACEIVAEVVRRSSRLLGVYPVSEPVALMTPSAVVIDGKACFYTLELPLLESNTDTYGIAFKQRMNTQLGYFSHFYGGQLPLDYQALAANLRVIMIRNTGNTFIIYMGLMNDPLIQQYVKNRN